MNWPLLAGGVLLLAVLALLLYWQINLAEGVYLGRRVVIWLYDRFAPRYDTVKQFDEHDEAWFLAPLWLRRCEVQRLPSCSTWLPARGACRWRSWRNRALPAA